MLCALSINIKFSFEIEDFQERLEKLIMHRKGQTCRPL